MVEAALSAPPNTSARILDGAFDAISDFGLSRTTVEDVAQRAGLSRQTIYRYFPSKDHLVVALVAREEERLLEGVRRVFAGERDLERAARGSLLFAIRFAREHPLLDRLLATDQETLLPYLTTRALPLLLRARQALLDLVIARARPADPALLAVHLDASVRAVVSYILTPSDLPPEEVARGLAHTLAGLARGGRTRASGRSGP
jgi:AcrR family transcriptional regulator